MPYKDREEQVFAVLRCHRRNKIRAVEYKGGRCQECGYTKSIAALGFHHRDPEQKSFGISGRTISWERMKAELDKCDLLCSNCHLEGHAKEADLRYEERVAKYKARRTK